MSALPARRDARPSETVIRRLAYYSVAAVFLLSAACGERHSPKIEVHRSRGDYRPTLAGHCTETPARKLPLTHAELPVRHAPDYSRGPPSLIQRSQVAAAIRVISAPLSPCSPEIPLP